MIARQRKGWAAREPDLRIRTHRPGDLGWILHRHGVLYSKEYGWNERFEALVAEVVAQFLASGHRSKERCWVAERGGRIVGAVMLARRSHEVGLLRLLYVEPEVRGHGVGERLVRTCIDFARDAGYRRLSLFTTHVLTAARRIYRRAGFVRVRSEPHRAFGAELEGETWELELA